jgi:flagellar motor switch protein FliG
MTIIVIVISFTLIWFGTTFCIVRYVIRLKHDLLGRFSDSEKPSKLKDDNIQETRVFKPFDYIKSVGPDHLLLFIKQEHPQVIALVLAHLEPDKASVILRQLPGEIQSDVSRRIATLDRLSPEIVREIERVLEKKLLTLSSEAYAVADGIESIAEILNRADRDSRNQIIKELEDEDPELAEAIKNELRVFKKPRRKIGKMIAGKGTVLAAYKRNE